MIELYSHKPWSIAFFKLFLIALLLVFIGCVGSRGGADDDSESTPNIDDDTGNDDNSSDDETGDDSSIDDDASVDDDDDASNDDSSDDDSYHDDDNNTDDDTSDDDNDDDSADDDSADDDSGDDSADDDNDDDTTDTDRDGISDAQEKLDGTDPLDPSDALAWHPDITEYPRLLTNAEGWLKTKEMILSDDPDAMRLFGRVRQMADRAPLIQNPDVFNFSLDETNGETASSAAFVAFVLNDEDYAAKAVEITSALHIDMAHWPLQDWDKGTICGGQALATFNLTYDLLKGFDLASEKEAEDMRNAILAYAAQLYAVYVEIPIAKFLQNNHQIKLTSGLGLTGITFNHTREAAKYVNLAMSEAPYILLDFQMPVGGGQAEGPTYLDYSFKTFLFFATAYHRFAHGEAYPYKKVCRMRLQLFCSPDVVEMNDPVTDHRMTDLLNWRILITLPNGYGPPIDDGYLNCGYNGPIAAIFNRQDYTWNYRSSPACSENTSTLALIELALLPYMPSPAPPAEDPNVFMPEAGHTILRTSWSPDTLYALLIGEHGKARLDGLGHEQADATSFILYGHHELLALDSGYGSYSDRERTARARNHNLILVDNEGPSLGLWDAFADADAYLTEFVNEPPFRSVRVDSAYRGATVSRRLLLIDDDYFATDDRVASDRSRTWSWLLHANAGGTTDGEFTLKSDGALIERPLAAMRTYLQSESTPLTFYQDEADHALFYGNYNVHAVLRGETIASATRFLHVSAAAATGEELPQITPDQNESLLVYYINTSDYSDALVTSDGNAFTLDANIYFPAQIESDAELVWARIDPSTNELVSSHYLGGTYLNIYLQK